MKRTVCILIFLAVFISGAFAASQNPYIAVVRGSFEKIERILKRYRIPFDFITIHDLEKGLNPEKYKSVYFPCGIDVPVESMIVVSSKGKNINSVTLNKNNSQADEQKVTHVIESYINDGGVAYFSGYSFKFLQNAFHLFEYHDNFPYMGLTGRIKSSLENDLARFCMKDSMALYMTHTGWISLKSVEDAEVLSSASYDTPRGERSGPISVLFRRGDGEVLYTSYHSTVYSDFRRYNIYRVAGAHLRKLLAAKADMWEQDISGSVVDSIHGRENYRIYPMNLYKGNNTIYFISEKDIVQVDIFDRDMTLIQSVDSFDKELEFDLKSSEKKICYVKVYPSSNKRYGIFSIVSARGIRFLPLYKRAGILIMIIILISLVSYTFLLVRKRGYSGTGRILN